MHLLPGACIKQVSSAWSIASDGLRLYLRSPL